MIAPNLHLLCEQAKLYYYDLLGHESRELIPESIIIHIEQCQNCHEQINQLQVVLSKTDRIEPEQGQFGSAVTTMLKLHFAYIDKRVTCETVRPFLPGLLDSALEIRVPTPITAHLDNCHQCAEDLETIRRLNLNPKQLCRLSQLFVESPSKNKDSCSQAQASILAVVFMAFRETNAEVLRHLCICPDCRKSLYEYREDICKDLDSRIGQGQFPCESVSATDIFDYVVPYGIDPANDQYVKFRESLTSHLRSCPTCLTKMQKLHQTIYNIAERAESEIVTIYHIDEPVKAQAVSESDELYAGFPIGVEITGRENRVDVEQPGAIIDFTNRLKHKVSALNMKALLKTSVAVAAVILIGLALLLNAPSAKAVTIEQIYTALENVTNVYIATFDPNKTEPTQERWVSRTSNIYITKTGALWILYDIDNGLRKSKNSDTGKTKIAQLTEDSITGIESIIIGSLGLKPYYDISDFPPDAEWNRATDDAIKAVPDGIEVYDLTWTKKTYSDSIRLRKWRFFVDSKTKLPQKIKSYSKLPADSKYTLQSERVIERLDESAIQDVIEGLSF
jgi:hypothetical protein